MYFLHLHGCALLIIKCVFNSWHKFKLVVETFITSVQSIYKSNAGGVSSTFQKLDRLRAVTQELSLHWKDNFSSSGFCDYLLFIMAVLLVI